MADTQFDSFGFSPDDLYLNPNETDLLIAALDSNRQDLGFLSNPSNALSLNPQSTSRGQQSADSPDHRSKAGQGSDVEVDGDTTPQNHPYLDHDTTEAVYDWNLNSLPPHYDPDDFDRAKGRQDSTGSDNGQDDGDTGNADAEEGETGDKRKNSEDLGEDDGGGKRQETDPKTGKKQTQRPGRKLLTSEPTTKRKAQNRAAQRAFRERKEKHLKDLELKVDELEKASEAANHENAKLKATIETLQTEVKEYRKRLSVNSNTNGGSPTFAGIGQPYSRASWDINNNFSFEFPTFGRVTDGKIQSAPLKGVANKGNSPPVASPASVTASMDNDLSSLFTADVLSDAESRSKSIELGSPNSQSGNSKTRTGSRPGNPSLHRASADSSGASPASTGSNIGLTSSCATTPEATCETPDQRKDTGAGVNGAGSGDKFGTQEAFCKKLQTACGNTKNPVPLTMSDSSNEVPALTPALTTQSHDSSVDLNGFDWLANQNGGAFDPILFADYREPQDNVMNNDFNFFNDAFPALNDYSSHTPQNQPLEPRLPKKKDLMQEIEEQSAGKEPEVVPGDERQQFLTCNVLWDRVQRSQRVQSGEADMDDLCTQLKAKAKCSGSGAVISQSDVDAILGPASKGNTEKDYLSMFK